MGLKFRRRQKLFPGVYINFSAKGISTTVGAKGLSLNFNKTGTYLNTGIPGTGLYDRKKISGKGKTRKSKIEHNEKSDIVDNEPNSYVFIPEDLKGEIKSKNANEVTSDSLISVKQTFIAAYQEKLEIENELFALTLKEKKAKKLKFWAKLLLVGLILKRFDNNYKEIAEYKKELSKQLNECIVNVDIEIDNSKLDEYEQISNSFSQLSTCEQIWDMTSANTNNDNRSSASQSVTREKTSIGFKKIKFLHSDYTPLYFKNTNGSDIYIYPGFVALFDNRKNFGLVSLNDIKVFYSESRFLEEGEVPQDSEIIDKTWAKVNKNGTPDKRFKGNYQIPIVRYGELKFKSKTGIHEVFLFSNAQKAKDFQIKFSDYVK